MKVLPHLSNLKGILGALVAVFAVCACEDEEIPADLNLTVSPKEVTLPADGGTATVSVNSPLAWVATSEASWVKVSPASGESGTSTLTLKVEATTSTSDKEGTVKVAIKDVGISQNVKVIQKGKEEEPPFVYQLSVSPDKLSFPVAGGSNSLTVTANEAWNASANANWITVTPASGKGNGTVTIKVQENTVDQKRDGVITFTCGDKEVSVAVSQEPFVYQLSVSPSSLEYEAAGGTLSVNVSANETWTANASASWITVSPASGRGNGTVSVKVDENRTENAKEGKITFTCGDKSAEVKVSQKPKVREEVAGFDASIDAWTNGTITIGHEFIPPHTEAAWSVYAVTLGKVYPMERTADGLYSVRVTGHCQGIPMFIVRDDDRLLGSVYQDSYSPSTGDNTEVNHLMYTSLTDHAIYSYFSNDIIVTLDPSELSITIEGIPHDWESIGTGEFVDGFISSLYGYYPRKVEVEILSDKNHPGMYKIVEPYANYNKKSIFTYTTIATPELVLRIKEDGSAYFKYTFTGLFHRDHGYLFASSLVPETGWSNFSIYGYLNQEEQTVYFTEYTVTELSYYGWYYSNRDGFMSVTLPGGKRTNYVLQADIDVQDTFFNVSVTHDVDTVKYAILEGALTVDEVVAQVPAIREDGQALEIDFYGEASADFQLEPGEYTVIVVAQGEGREVYSYQNFTVEDFSVEG